MSTTIDNRVVEMRFDNRHFERNVQTSMSTLDKLKQKLNFKDHAKGLEEINVAAKNNKIGVLGEAANRVSAKFSALQVMGVTALANITNSAVNAGKRIVSALTIDPVKTGFNEYELKMGSIRTIMASTGKDLETVNKYLNELNEYSDKTIYSFSDMTQNIGKFTNAGVDLEDAVLAIKGISNEAALAGANSNEASRAMYNFAQALSAGYVKLIDWKSIELANMATVEFKTQLLNTAVALGTVTKVGDDTYKTLAGDTYNAMSMFNDGLKDQWMTSDVLISTLKDYADETTEIGAKATQAATQIETFSKLMDTLKESAQSGWARTWELIFGNYYEGMNLWTTLGKVVGGVIDKMSDIRNNFLESALGMSFKGLEKTVKKALGPVDKAIECTETITASLEDLGKVVDEVILGKFGNGKERLDKLTKAGYNYYKVQNKVNEKLGDSTRHSDKLIEAQEKLLGNQEETVTETKKETKEVKTLSEARVKYLKKLSKLNEEQLKSIGCTEEEIAALKELHKVADQLGMPIEEVIDNLDELNGRWILLHSFANIGENIANVFKSIGAAAKEVFGTLKPESLFNLITAFHRLTEKTMLSAEALDNITSIFKGLFAIVDIVSRIVGGGLRIAFMAIGSVFNAFGMTALDAAAGVGELVYRFDQWLKEHDYIAKAIDYLAEKLPPIVEKVKEFVKELYIDSGAAENFKKIAGGLESIWNVLHGQFVWTLNSALKILKSVLELFGTNFTEVLAVISEYISKAVDWIASNTMIIDGISKISEIIFLVITGVGKLIKAFMELEPVQKLIKNISEMFERLFGSFDFEFKGTALESLYKWIEKTFVKLEKWVKNLDAKEWFKAGIDSINGFLLGLESGLGDVLDTVSEIANQVIDKFKEILQINSPSKVMIAIGGYVILGLVHGIVSGEFTLFKAIGDLVANVITMFGEFIQNGIPVIWDLIKEIGSQFADHIKSNEIDFGAIFVIGSAIAVIYLLKKAVDMLDAIRKTVFGFADVLDGVTGILKQFRENMKLKKWTIIAECIKSVAISLAILAGSLILLSKCDPKKLGIALAIMLGLVTELAILMAVGAKLDPTAFGKIAVMTLSLSAAMLIMAFAVKRLSKLNIEEAMMGISLLTSMFLMLVGLTYMLGKLDWKQLRGMDQVGVMILKLSIGIGIMAVALKMIGSMSAEEAFQGMFIIAAMSALMLAFAKLGDMKTKNPFQIGNMFMKMAGAMLIMAFAMRIVGGMSIEDIAKGVIVFGGFTAMFYALNKASALATKTSPLAAKAFLSFAGAVVIIAFALRLLGSMSGEDIIKGMAAVVGIELIFEMYSKVSAKAGESKANAAKGFMWMAVGIVAAALAIRLLAGMNIGDITKGMIVIALMEGLFILAGNALSNVGPYVDEAGKLFMKMGVAILILVGAIALLSLLNPDNVIRGTACISAMLICMSVLAGVTKFANVTKEMQTTLLVMAGIIGAFAGIIALLSLLDPQAVATSAAALSTVMLSLAAAMLIMGKAGRISTTVSKQLIPMLAVVAGLGFIIGLLSTFTNTDNAIQAAVALSILLEAFAVSLTILGASSRILPTVSKHIWSMVGVVAALAVILGLLTAFDVAPSIETATSLSILLLALSASLGILGAIGMLGLPAMATGVLGLLILIAAIGSVVVALAGLNRLFDGELERLLDEGIPLLEKIGKALGSFVGGIVGGIGEAATNSLPNMAENLSSFMDNLSGFIEGSKDIDVDAVNGIANLVKMIALMTGANFLDRMMSAFTGQSSMSSFSEQLELFGDAIISFSKKMSEEGAINIDAINKSVEAGKAIAGLAEAIPKTGGLKQLFSGENNLEDFGGQLASFGLAIAGYSAILASNPLNVELIQESAKAGKALAGMAEAIPDNGKLFNMFGTSNIQQFANDITWFAYAISGFSKVIVQNGGLNTEVITQAANAGKALAKMASEIPDSGKLFNMFGESNLETFSADLPLFGAAIAGLSKSLTEDGGINVESITAAAKAGKALAQMAKAIPDSGKLFSMFGESNLETFSSDLKLFGKAICAFSKSVTDLDVEAVTAAEPAIASLKRAIKGLDKIDTTGVTNFKTAVSTLAGVDVDGFVDNFKGKSADLTSVGTKMSNTFVAGLKSNKEAATKAGSSLAKAFKTGATNTKGLKKAGQELATKLADGLDAKKDNLKKAGETLANKAKTGARDKRDTFKKAGKYLGDGLIEGINDKKQAAYNAGYALGKKAAQGVKDGSDENSPSKLTYQYGIWQGEGLINGIVAMGKKAYNAGYNLGNDTAEAMSNSIKKISSLINSDMDVQPTIRPVLDLSDVEAGVGSIGGMFNSETLGVSSNLGAIRSAINRKNQNGVNADVVSAIDKLSKNLGDKGDTYYTIDGVRYDGESSVATAIEEITRAALMERRV